MPQKDPVIKREELAFTKKGTFNLTDLYYTGKDWFKSKGYSFLEKSYEDEISGNNKSTIISWEAKKGLNEYNSSKINIKISVENYKSSKKQGKRIVEGILKIGFTSELVSDEEKKWESNPLQQLLRAIHDKFTINSRLEKFQDLIKKDTYLFYEKIKNYLGAEKP